MMEKSEYTIELAIRKEYSSMNLRAALNIPAELIRDALTPLRKSSNSLSRALENQLGMEQQMIIAAREKAAKLIAADIVEFLQRELFTLYDTMDGYTKEQR